MKCHLCKTENSEDSYYCMKCGNKLEGKKRNDYAVASFILSLLFFIPLAPLIGFFLGIFALYNMKKHPDQIGKGFAIAGIIIGLLFSIIIPLIVFGFFVLVTAPLS